MGRRHDEGRTRENQTRNYPADYERRRGYERRDYHGEARYGPYDDRDGARFYEDDYGNRYYAERDDDRYVREREREREGY